MKSIRNIMSRGFGSGLIVGAAISAAGLVGYAYGNSQAEEAPQVTSQDLHRELEAGNCQVQVGFGQYTGGTQCYFNKVMVGTQSNMILCADLTVSCN